MHRITIIGRLGQDPEMRYSQAGAAVTSFSVASNNVVKGENQTEWVRVSVFNKLAETCNQHLSKGKQVYVEGPFQLRYYTAKDGGAKSSLEMVGATVQFLSPVEASVASVATPEEDLPF